MPTSSPRDTPVLYLVRVGITPMRGQRRGQTVELRLSRRHLPGKTSVGDSLRKERVVLQPTPRDQPRASSRINDNYCVTKLQARLLAGSPTTRQTLDTFSNVKFPVVHSVHTAPGHSQKRDPGSAGCYCRENKLKYVKSVSCITQLCCVKPVTNLKSVASNLPVGARLQNFWQTWLDLGAGPKAVQILKEGYTLPFRIQAKTHKVSHSHKLLCKSPQESLPAGGITSAYRQKCSGTSTKPNISGFFNRLFLVPKPSNKWRPILDLSKLNLFLKAAKFKMETPETIRTSLQPGEWVTSIDFKDAYFHIPMQEQSRKYLRFHVQGQTYQFKALPFGLSTDPWSSL